MLKAGDLRIDFAAGGMATTTVELKTKANKPLETSLRTMPKRDSLL